MVYLKMYCQTTSSTRFIKIDTVILPLSNQQILTSKEASFLLEKVNLLEFWENFVARSLQLILFKLKL